MAPRDKINPLIVGSAIFVLILVMAFWYWQNRKSSEPIASPTQVSQKVAESSLGSQILKKIQNPIKDKLPETNPFSAAETNPLKKIIKNPF